jgi:hypothetical protein
MLASALLADQRRHDEDKPSKQDLGALERSSKQELKELLEIDEKEPEFSLRY